MQRYRDLSGSSGVAAFDIGRDWIDIRFKDHPRIYHYGPAKPGRTHVDRMKPLARAGRGLATYINKYVRDNYESWR